MKARCLNPHSAWICGVIRSKSDGILSPHMVFLFSAALKYYTDIYGSDVGLVMVQRNEISVPCGNCAACQIRKRKEWTTRLSLESRQYDDNCCFITLTYDDDNIPVTDFKRIGDKSKLVDRGVGELPLPTLLVSDVQKFIKRLRRYLEYQPKSAKKRLARDYVPNKIRYYAVGEYGGKFGRPHYHLMIFGWKPSDMTFFKEYKGHVVYRSAQIEKLWRFGFSTVEPVQGGVAKYCSRYVTKKFARLSSKSPFCDCVLDEFYLQSVRDGGIGAKWYDENFATLFELGYCNIPFGRGSGYYKAEIPTYFLRRARKKHPMYWLQLRDERLIFAARDSKREEDYADLVRAVQCYQEQEKRYSQDELF